MALDPESTPGFEDAVTDEAQALGKAGNQALGPATKQGGRGSLTAETTGGDPEERREGCGRPGHPSLALASVAVSGQRWRPVRTGSAGPRQLQLQAELSATTSATAPPPRLMALGNAPGCSGDLPAATARPDRTGGP